VQKGSEAYNNLSKAIKDRLAVLKEKVAFTSKTDAPVPFREDQLRYSASGNIEYLDVKLETGELFTLKREDGGEWFVERSSGGKTTNAEVLGRVPGRYKKPLAPNKSPHQEKERGFDESNKDKTDHTESNKDLEKKSADYSGSNIESHLTDDPYSAQSVREAEDWAMQYLDIPEVSYIGMSLEMAIKFNLYFKELIGTYKHFKLNRIFVDGAELSVQPATTLYVNFNSRTFGIVHFKEETALFESYANNVLSEIDGVANRIWVHFPEEMMLQVEISHEFGHLVQWDLHVMADAGDLMAARLLDEFAEIMRILPTKEIEKISRYANLPTKRLYSNTRFKYSEGFAESFSIYINGKDKEVLPHILFDFFETKLMPHIKIKE
jgi:hypothetical protein